jgi:glycosyltransferase involved in cell wall biosynthesis
MTYSEPVVSIVTAVFNGENHIEQTINSVLSQSYLAIEYIVIDGDSTDSTLDIVEKYSDSIATIVSEPDEGIAHAMNKGAGLANGEYLFFLHSDDYFESTASLANFMVAADKSGDIIAGGIEFSENGAFRRVMSRGFSFWLNLKGLPHQATICRKSLFLELGGFDTGFKICMDYDFFLRAYRKGYTCKTTDSVLAVMRDAGVSSRRDSTGVKARLLEEKAVHEKNCASWWLSLIYRVWWTLYPIYKMNWSRLLPLLLKRLNN